MFEWKELKGFQTIIELHCYRIIVALGVVIGCSKNTLFRVVSLNRETECTAFQNMSPAKLFLIVGLPDVADLNNAVVVAIDNNTFNSVSIGAIANQFRHTIAIQIPAPCFRPVIAKLFRHTYVLAIHLNVVVPPVLVRGNFLHLNAAYAKAQYIGQRSSRLIPADFSFTQNQVQIGVNILRFIRMDG